jgi:phospholipid N-methyltransferase
MPASHPENKPWSAVEIKKLNPQTVLDVGVGSGVYRNIIKNIVNPDAVIHGIEAWEPYVEMFDLKNRYDKIFVQDAREFEDFHYDLVIFGDVLEHMPESDAVALWEKVAKQAKYALIAIPIMHYPQGAAGGNPFEVHHEEDWNTERVLKTFTGIITYKEFSQTGAFIARF